jgi:hypothetical protein
VYESELAAVKVGDAATVRVDAYPGEPFNWPRHEDARTASWRAPRIRTASVKCGTQEPGERFFWLIYVATLGDRELLDPHPSGQVHYQM